MNPSLKRLLRPLLGTKSRPGPRRVVLPDRPPGSPERYLAVAATFRNEAPYLAEWIEFQRLVGVEHLYLYDHGSSDGSEAVLAPFVDEGFVTVTPWALPRHVGSVTAQMTAFAHAILCFGPSWRWMAFIDVDEFLFPVRGQTLPEVLRSYDDLPALAVFWAMFGYSGHDVPPPGSVIENYTMRAPFPTHAKPKCIVNPAEVVAITGAHLFDLSAGEQMAFTESRQVHTMQRVVTERDIGQVLRLHHYYTRSRRDFDAKVNTARIVGRDSAKLLHVSAMIEEAPIHDETILRFAPALRERLNMSHQRPDIELQVL